MSLIRYQLVYIWLVTEHRTTKSPDLQFWECATSCMRSILRKALIVLLWHPGWSWRPCQKTRPWHHVRIPWRASWLRNSNWRFQVCKDTPDLCGGFVVWLTKEARTWLGGRYVSVAWDVTELEAMKDEILTGDKLKFRMVVWFSPH